MTPINSLKRLKQIANPSNVALSQVTGRSDGVRAVLSMTGGRFFDYMS